jgi:peptide/nickel transport system substrate-binding protein
MTFHRRKIGRIGAVAVTTSAVILALVACSNQPTSAAKQTLTIAMSSVPTSLDPSKGSGGPNTLTQDPAYQGLLHVTGASTVSPNLAESFRWVGGGNTTFEIKLRPGLRFSDGTPLNANAVKTSIEHFKGNGSVFAYAASAISSIDTPDTSTVVFHLSQPTPEFPLNLAEGTGMGMIISPKALTEKIPLGTSTDGAGPYQLSSSGTVQGSVYTFTPNKYYYDPAAIKFGKIVVKVIADATTALSALRSGQVDVTYGELTTYKSAKSYGLNEVAYPINILGVWLLDQDGKLAPEFANVKVRQAIEFAIDRKSIAKAITAGTGVATDQNALPGTLGYLKSLENAYPYNPEKAKKLLAAAGYANGFSMSIAVPVGSDYGTLSQAFAEQLSKVGIKVSIDPASTFPAWVQQVLSNKFPGAVVGLSLLGMPAAMDNLFSANALMNPAHTNFSTVVDGAAAASKLSGAEATAAWSAVNKATVDEALQVPVTTEATIYYWGKSVTGVGDSSSANPVFFSPAK